MNIQKVRFWRTHKDKKASSGGEEGIIINEGDGVIVDAKGQAVPRRFGTTRRSRTNCASTFR
jgi:hypothetical protein